MGTKCRSYRPAHGHSGFSHLSGGLGAEPKRENGAIMKKFISTFWIDEQGQDVAEYSIMLAVILVIVVGTVRLIGSNAQNVFSNVASSIQ